MRCTVVSRTRRNFELNFDHHNYNLYFILLPRAVQRTFKVLHHSCTRWEFIFVRHTCMRTALYAFFLRILCRTLSLMKRKKTSEIRSELHGAPGAEFFASHITRFKQGHSSFQFLQ